MNCLQYMHVKITLRTALSCLFAEPLDGYPSSNLFIMPISLDTWVICDWYVYSMIWFNNIAFIKNHKLSSCYSYYKTMLYHHDQHTKGKTWGRRYIYSELGQVTLMSKMLICHSHCVRVCCVVCVGKSGCWMCSLFNMWCM